MLFGTSSGTDTIIAAIITVAGAMLIAVEGWTLRTLVRLLGALEALLERITGIENRLSDIETRSHRVRRTDNGYVQPTVRRRLPQ